MKRIALLIFAMALSSGGAVTNDNEIAYVDLVPGILVVTNAPSRAQHAVVSAEVVRVEGKLDSYILTNAPSMGGISGTYVTNTVNDLTGPRLSLLEGRTNVWNATPSIYRLEDSQSASYFQTVENGTGTVWAITGPFTNYNVSLSPDFAAVSNGDRPAWTNSAWPVTLGSYGFWYGYQDGDGLHFDHIPGDENNAYWQGGEGYPATLVAVQNAAGTAVVSQNVYYVTNILHRYATEARLESCYEVVSGEVAEVAYDLNGFMATNVASLQPQTRTLYGNLAITNQAGYGSFAATNAAQANINLALNGVASTNTATLQYPFTGQRFLSASCVTYAAIGLNATISSATLWLIDGTGAAVASNTVTATRIDSTAWPYFTNTLSYTGAAITNGALRLTVTMGKSGGLVASGVYSGGVTPLTLRVTQVPLDYVTTTEAASYVRNSGGAATNLTLAGSFILTNGLAITGGWSNVYPTVRIRWGTTNLNIVVKAPE